MGPRGAGRRLNDQQRMEILDILAREEKVKNVDLAKRYGVSEGAIRKLKQVKDRVRDRYFLGNEHNRDKRKRGGFVRNAQFEQELYQWICRMREAQAYQLLPLTQTAVRQQAMLFAQKYERMGSFKASPGWFARFCSRHRLDPPMTSSATGAPAVASGAAAVEQVKATDAAAAVAAVFQLPALPDADALLGDVVKQDAEDETIDEQTKLAARQHNIVALSIATSAAASGPAPAPAPAPAAAAAAAPSAAAAAAAPSAAAAAAAPSASASNEMVAIAPEAVVAAPEAGTARDTKSAMIMVDDDSEEKAPASAESAPAATAASVRATVADAASTMTTATSTTTTTTTTEVVGARMAAVAAPPTEDEIFSLGL